MIYLVSKMDRKTIIQNLLNRKEFFIKSDSSVQTRKLGEIFAQAFQKMIKEGLFSQALTVGLTGELGSGKTVFVQGLAKGLGIKEKITSPTFVIMKGFSLKDLNFYHFDCYRLEKPEDLLGLGFSEILRSPQNLIAIEWAEKIQNLLPPTSFWIKFEYLTPSQRKISVL